MLQVGTQKLYNDNSIIVVSRQGKSAFSVIRFERKDMHDASIRTCETCLRLVRVS